MCTSTYKCGQKSSWMVGSHSVRFAYNNQNFQSLEIPLWSHRKIYFEMDSIEPIGPENHVSNQLLTPGQLFLLLTYRNRPPASTMHHGPLISHMIYSQTIAKLYITWPHNEYYSRVLLLFDGHICRGFM